MINIKFAPKKKEYITSETRFAVGNHIIFFILSFPIFPHQAVRPESIRLLTAYSYIVYRFYAFVNLCIKSEPPLVMHHAPGRLLSVFVVFFGVAQFLFHVAFDFLFQFFQNFARAALVFQSGFRRGITLVFRRQRLIFRSDSPKLFLCGNIR